LYKDIAEQQSLQRETAVSNDKKNQSINIITNLKFRPLLFSLATPPIVLVQFSGFRGGLEVFMVYL